MTNATKSVTAVQQLNSSDPSHPMEDLPGHEPDFHHDSF